MAGPEPLVIHSFSPPGAHQPTRGATTTHVELAERRLSVTGPDRLHAQVRRRHNNDRAIIENPLAHLTDEALAADVRCFSEACLPNVDPEKILRAARVAKDIRTYDGVARSSDPDAGYGLPVDLTPEEKQSLKAEKDSLREKGMLIVILTVSLAAFLQGHVQSSLNGSVPYLGCIFDTFTPDGQCNAIAEQNGNATTSPQQIGAVNSAPFFFAAAVGCPLALPVNDLFGRKGAMAIAALLIFASSLASPFAKNWQALFGIRVINGVGMGIKAVSTPILASETSVGFWRGSSILAWQLWVAFGIMIGFVLNLIFSQAEDHATTAKLILGAPFVPSLMLLVGLYFCPESPRYYMRARSSSYDPSKAYGILKGLRRTELQALRDLYLVYKSIEQENSLESGEPDRPDQPVPHGLLDRLVDYCRQYRELFGGARPGGRRRRNALISSATVNLAQQLCGINILAFYSTTLFQSTGSNTRSEANLDNAMYYSFGYGAINFFFGLPAIRTIDTLGRRKWLTITLPPMTVFMLAAALSNYIHDDKARIGVTVMWLFLFAAAYSPGLGPMPFTLASESFPLSHREAGCAFAIAVNLLFAGVLSISFPPIHDRLGNSRVLFIFAGLNLLAFILVFTLVEETKRRSLEDLDMIFAVPKRRHIRHQVGTYLPWFIRYYLLGQRDRMRPSLYVEWNLGGSLDSGHHAGGQPGDEREAERGGGHGEGYGEYRVDDRQRESDSKSIASAHA